MPSFRLSDLARRVSGEVQGGGDPTISGVAPLDVADESQLSFLTNPKYRAQAIESKAGVLLVPAESKLEGRRLLVHEEPYVALAALLELFHPPVPRVAGVSPQAIVAPDVEIDPTAGVAAGAVIDGGVKIAAGAFVGPGCVIGANVSIGEASELRPNVVVYPQTQIGARCLVHAGVVLGADGFGFATSGETHHKVPQVGRVVLEDDVEVGANSAIDRGTLEDTVIGAGTKIDDLVMVAHGVRVGRGSLLAAQSGIAGSTRLGAFSMLAGQSGVAGHLTLGDRTVVGAKSAVLSDLPDGGFVAGIPAVEHQQWKRAQATFRRLPALKKEIGDLRRRLERLEQELAKAEDRS